MSTRHPPGDKRDSDSGLDQAEVLKVTGGKEDGSTNAESSSVDEKRGKRLNPEPATYKKRKCAANMSGELFEVKMAALVYLRCINQPDNDFFIASNMDAAGAFDDLVVSVLKGGVGEWKTAFIQLKHITADKQLTKQAFSGAIRGNFNLNKYCDSFRQIKDAHPTHKDLQRCGDFNSFEFVLLMNKQPDSKFREACVEKQSELHSLLKTGDNGKTVSLADHEDIKADLAEFSTIRRNLDELLAAIENKSLEIESIRERVDDIFSATNIKEFKFLQTNPTLNNLRRAINECKVAYDDVTQTEFLANFILSYNQASEAELEKLIKDEIKLSWQTSAKEIDNMYDEVMKEIQEWYRGENDLYLLTRDSGFWSSIIRAQISKLSAHKFDELSNYGIQFQETPICPVDVLRREIPDSGVMHVLTGGGTSLSLIKIKSALHKENVLCVSMATLLDQADVLAAWRSRWCDYLVIDCEVGLQEETDVPKICVAIQEVIEMQRNKRIIVVSDGKNNQFSRLLKMDIKYCEFPDISHWGDLDNESQQRLISQEINLQGNRIPLENLFAKDDYVTKHLNGPTLSRLLKNELTLGKIMEKPIDYYIPRTLCRNGVAIDVSSVADMEERVVVVSAESGMGKSTLLTHLSKTIKDDNKAMWIVRINLKDCTHYLEKLEEANINKLTAQDFLIWFGTSNKDSVEEIVFKHSLESNNVALFVDGVDEVCPHYADKTMLLLKCLAGMQIKHVWVTCRPVVQTILENTLLAEPFTLQPFTDADQQNFLCRFWVSRNINAEESYLREYGVKLLELAKSLYSVNFVIQIPLLAALLAEVYEEPLKECIRKNRIEFPKKLDLMHLYDAFVKKKFDVYFNEKKEEDYTKPANIEDSEKIKRDFNENYMYIALKVVLKSDFKSFDISNKEHRESKTSEFLEEVKLGKEKIGIIVTIDDQPKFIHPTFAEYFVAKWLTSNYKKNSDILKKYILQPPLKVICEIFDRSLANDFPLHTAVLNRDVRSVENVVTNVNEIDAGGRTALHLVAMYSGVDKTSDYLDMAKLLLNKDASTETRDAVFKWTPLQYADYTRAWSVAGLILQKGGDSNELFSTKNSLHDLVYKELVEYLSTSGQRSLPLLRAAAKHKDMEVMKFLVNEGCDIPTEMEEHNNLMHLAAEGGCVETMGYLREHGVSFVDTDENLNTPLHSAAAHGKIQAVKFLTLQKSDVNVQNKKLETPLILASQSGGDLLEILRFLIDHGSEVNHTDIDGRSVLHFVASNGGMATVAYLISAGCIINKQSNDGSEPLHCAARENQFDSMRCLLENGANVNCVDNEGRIPLHYCAQNGETNIVQCLVNRGSDINRQSKNGFTPLDLAAMCGEMSTIQFLMKQNATFGESRDDLDEQFNVNLLLLRAATQGKVNTCRTLLSQNADVNYYGSGGNCALHLATLQGHLESIKYLCDNSANVGKPNKDGDTALQIAIRQNHEDAVVFLLQEESKQMVLELDDRLPIHLAAQAGNLSVILYFVKKGVDVDSRDLNGNTPLNTAAGCGKCDLVRSLVEEHEASIIPNNDGFLPLHIATQNGHLNTVEFLVESKKIDIDKVTHNNETALYWASHSGKLDIIEFLVNRGARFIPNKERVSPLHVACAEGHLPVVEYFLNQCRADVKEVTKTRDTSLHLAAASGRLEIVKLLVSKDGDVDCNVDGYWPIHLASRNGHFDVVKYLLDNGGKVCKETKKKRTALYFASECGHLKVVELLLKRGAVIKGDKTNKTPLHVAAQGGHRDVVDWLICHGAHIEACDNKGETPLFYAAMEGHLDVVSLLVERHGACVNVASKKQMTPLCISARLGRAEVVKYLIQHGADHTDKRARILAEERGHCSQGRTGANNQAGQNYP